MADQKVVRVGVLFGFQQSAAVDEKGDVQRVIHLPGAVIDLSEDDARVEIARNRVVPVEADTPLREGHQPETLAVQPIDFAKHSAEEVAARTQGAP